MQYYLINKNELANLHLIASDLFRHLHQELINVTTKMHGKSY